MPRYGSVIVIKNIHHHNIDARALRNLFGMTQAEAEVCRHLCMGLSVKSIADIRNVKESTVRSQLKIIFQMLNVSRTQDLIIKILNSLAIH